MPYSLRSDAQMLLVALEGQLTLTASTTLNCKALKGKRMLTETANATARCAVLMLLGLKTKSTQLFATVDTVRPILMDIEIVVLSI